MAEEATSTVVRVVRLLQCVAEMGGEISVKEFAQRLSLPPSTVHRLLKLLMTQGLIEQRATTQRYRAGRELFRISSLITRQIDRTLKRVDNSLLTDGKIHVILCGTAAALPDRDRAGPCTAVIAGPMTMNSRQEPSSMIAKAA